MAQAVLHRQRQLDAACPRADQGDARFARVPLHALQQRQPAVVEQMNRLDRHRVLGGAGHLAHFGGRADVDGEPVVGHGWPVFAQHFAVVPVQPDDLVFEKSGTRKSRQSAQVNVHVVIAVMAGNVAWQHARIRRVAVAANHR